MTDEEKLPSRSKSWLWVLAVFAAFFVLGALWFAIFGSPARVGTDTAGGGFNLYGFQIGGTGSAGQTKPLTESDVRDVLGRIDYIETTDAPAAEYADAMRAVVTGVDVGPFAQATLESNVPVRYASIPGAGTEVLTGAEKSAVVAQALQAYQSLENATGTAGALESVMETHLNPGGDLNKTREGALLDVVAQGLSPIGLLFGAQDADSGWTWRIDGVRITGPDSAVVTYSAATTPGNSTWRFIDPTMSYEKQLRFVRNSKGTWLLAAWPNEPAFRAKFFGNITPPDATVEFDEWWATL
jgi:hypothetical protein